MIHDGNDVSQNTLEVINKKLFPTEIDEKDWVLE